MKVTPDETFGWAGLAQGWLQPWIAKVALLGLCWSLMLGGCCPSASAQVALVSNPGADASGALVQGLLYYAVENLDSHQVIQRGTTGANGSAFSQLILAPNTRFRVWVLEAATLRVGDVSFTTPPSGSTFKIPDFALQDESAHDADGDGLPDLGEFILGTDPLNPDTDGDGIPDGAEVRQGTDPLSGLAVRTGVVGSASAPGTAVDIFAANDMAIVASLDRGISLFNIFNGMNPLLIGQVDTPGEARAVAASGNLVAVADGPAGLAIIDITDPPSAKLKAQIKLGSYAQAVTTAAGVAYVGLQSGQLVAADLVNGALLQRLSLGPEIFDLAIEGDYLFVLLGTELRSFRFADGALVQVGKVNLDASGADGLTKRKRLFVGGGYAWATASAGFDTVDIHDPANLVRVGQLKSTGPNSFKQIVANGSGLGVAAVGVTPRSDGTQHISLYDVSNPQIVTNFLGTLITPEIAYAVSIYNGLAYVADGANGLQVVNYLAYDNKKVPPAISLTTTAQGSTVEEGKAFLVTASVSDDVQVRNVEFYVDGIKGFTDGNFPFEYRLITPVRTGQKTSFRLRARASDTGGNATWSDELTFNLGPDVTPPALLRVEPAAGAISGSVDTLFAYFTEPINPASVNSLTFKVVAAGADGIFGTADDLPAQGGTISYREAGNTVVLSFSSILSPGLYRASVGPPLADLAGNALVAPQYWSFWVVPGQDSDHDGLPDDVEILLGLDPFNSDSKGDGVRDGDRDFDNDGLSNAAEILLGTDPRNPHTLNPKILDGDLDLDNDGLSNALEFRYGTNPFVADTDGDGWTDEAEITGGSDPLDPASKPKLHVQAQPSLSIGLTGSSSSGGTPFGPTVAQPPVSLSLPAFLAAQGSGQGLTVAQPSVSLSLPAFQNAVGSDRNVTVAQPPVRAGFNSQ